MLSSLGNLNATTMHALMPPQINTSAALAAIFGGVVVVGFAWLRGWMGIWHDTGYSIYQKRTVRLAASPDHTDRL